MDTNRRTMRLIVPSTEDPCAMDPNTTSVPAVSVNARANRALRADFFTIPVCDVVITGVEFDATTALWLIIVVVVVSSVVDSRTTNVSS